MKAIWNETVIAESADTEVVEGNHYFPAAAVKSEYLKASPTHTICPWKGTASYYSLVVDGKENTDAAWYYPAPNPNEGFRKITVEVASDVGKKYRVQVRPGYRPRGGF